MERIYLYLTANKSISYDDNNLYVDDIPQQQNEGDGIINFKKKALAEANRLIINDISKYVSHFKNIAVLLYIAFTNWKNGNFFLQNEKNRKEKRNKMPNLLK